MVTFAMTTISAYGRTDVGKVRQNNEDSWGEVPSAKFYVIADGMGGHKAGEVASSQTVAHLCRLIKDQAHDDQIDPSDLLLNAIQEVNERIFQLSLRDDQLRGMGTTLCCIHFHQNRAICAHVGDSRIYRLKQGKLALITSDHSLLQELLDLEQITEEEASEFVYRNIITKAIGTEPFVDPTISTFEIAIGDIFMMCTDGLSDLLSIEEMQWMMQSSSSVEKMVNELVDLANSKGGIDNISAVVMKVEKT